jgi:hypothetical protein
MGKIGLVINDLEISPLQSIRQLASGSEQYKLIDEKLTQYFAKLKLNSDESEITPDETEFDELAEMHKEFEDGEPEIDPDMVEMLKGLLQFQTYKI